MTTRVIGYGLGPIGIGILRLAMTRSALRVVGAVDLDPAKIGHDLGAICGGETHDVAVVGDLAEALAAQPQVALHATGSALERVAPQLHALIEAGLHVISTCEELSYPWVANPQIAADLDAAARRRGVVVLGTGVNPGYAMDALPLVLTAPCTIVRSVRVLRVVDAARRRGPLQRKVGAGLTPDAFAARVTDGSVRHVGLPESLQMLAGALGWNLDSHSDTIQPMIADRAIVTEYVQVAPGQVAGVHQIARGFVAGREVLTLELRMYVGAHDPQDTIIIDGDPAVHTTIHGGLHGDLATAAMVVNAVNSLSHARPGLATMDTLPLVHWRG